MEIAQEKINAAYKVADENTKKVLDALFGKFGESEVEKRKNMLKTISYKMSQHQPDIFNGEEITLIDSLIEQNLNRPYYINGRGIYIPFINKVIAMKDAFEGNEVKWEYAVKAGAPTRDEWYIILYFKDEIQRLLEENDGQPLVNDYYWSSAEAYSGNAWGVAFTFGYIDYFAKCGGFRVRPVSAF